MPGRNSGGADTSSGSCTRDSGRRCTGSRVDEHGLSRVIAANLFSCGKSPAIARSTQLSTMVDSVSGKLRRLCSRLRWGEHKRKVTLLRGLCRASPSESLETASIAVNSRHEAPDSVRSIRLATFNVAMFSMAPAVPGAGSGRPAPAAERDIRGKSANDRPKGILKERNNGRPKMRVSINLPDNEISLGRIRRSKSARSESFGSEAGNVRSGRAVMDVLKEVGADVVALQNVKADEENGMKPLSELADGLGMRYVFAESWAPEYGNAILSRWPIKRWKVQKISDDSDHRNMLRATIEVPRAGEINFHCTHLDHLDEGWRMKQINNILKSSDGAHILAGGLNSLDETDYSEERWNDIVKYHVEIGKPVPKVEVMRFLKQRQYVDAKNFAGECEQVVVAAKGQGVQGTCKYGTRVDYLMVSPDSPYRFVPGSYVVVSSKGTSDHHVVKADLRIVDQAAGGADGRRRRPKQNVLNVTKASSSKGIWGVRASS